MTGRLVTLESLGGWLIKCNGDRTDIDGWARSGRPVDGWCVQPGYRTRLMAAGQPVLFWVSGRRAPGIWGLGRLTGAPATTTGGARPRVPLAVTLLAPADRVPREVLRADDRLADLEVFRQPQAANPSFVSVPQRQAIEDYLRWPPECGTSGQ